jgi:hypothetical protein
MNPQFSTRIQFSSGTRSPIDVSGWALTADGRVNTPLLKNFASRSLHEVVGRMWLGPPKSKAAARRIDLPPFLIGLLAEVMDGHEHEQVFCGPSGAWLRRSNFGRRLWRPCDGDLQRGWPPVLTGAVFHGLRHFHKTVLEEADPPPVLVHERMGTTCLASKASTATSAPVCAHA